MRISETLGKATLALALGGCNEAQLTDTAFEAGCSSDYAEVFPEETLSPNFRMSTDPPNCQFGEMDSVDGETPINGNLNIFYGEDGELMLGADEVDIDDYHLNGSIPLDEYSYCQDGSFEGSITKLYGTLIFRGFYREAETDECVTTGYEGTNFVPSNQVLYGWIYKDDYGNMQGTFSANRYIN